MGFLKVFRWIAFGFGLMFLAVVAFFSLYYIVPEGMIKQIIEESLASSNLTLPVVLLTYGVLGAIGISIFVIFTIIVSVHKRKKKYAYTAPEPKPISRPTSSSSSTSTASLSNSYTALTGEKDEYGNDIDGE